MTKIISLKYSFITVLDFEKMMVISYKFVKWHRNEIIVKLIEVLLNAIGIWLSIANLYIAIYTFN